MRSVRVSLDVLVPENINDVAELVERGDSKLEEKLIAVATRHEISKLARQSRWRIQDTVRSETALRLLVDKEEERRQTQWA